MQIDEPSSDCRLFYGFGDRWVLDNSSIGVSAYSARRQINPSARRKGCPVLSQLGRFFRKENTVTRKKLALKLALAVIFAIIMTVIRRFEPSLF